MAKDKVPDSDKRRRGRPHNEPGAAIAKIRAAALKAFARHGFEDASIADIAASAGVAKPLVFYHFRNKEMLWEAALSEAFSEMQAELSRETLLTSPDEDALKLISQQLVKFAAKYPELVRIVVLETGLGGSRANWLQENYLLPAYRLASAVIQAFFKGHHSAAKIPGPEHIIPLILGVINFPHLEADVIRAAFSVEVNSDAYLHRHSELLYRVLRALV